MCTIAEIVQQVRGPFLQLILNHTSFFLVSLPHHSFHGNTWAQQIDLITSEWLHNSELVSELHWHRRGRGFESCWRHLKFLKCTYETIAEIVHQVWRSLFQFICPYLLELNLENVFWWSCLATRRKSLSKRTPCWIMPTFPHYYKSFSLL